MERLYRFVGELPTNSKKSIANYNKFKVESKEKALQDYISTYNILDVKTIKFEESEEKVQVNQSIIYYVTIITSEL